MRLLEHALRHHGRVVCAMNVGKQPVGKACDATVDLVLRRGIRQQLRYIQERPAILASGKDNRQSRIVHNPDCTLGLELSKPSRDCRDVRFNSLDKPDIDVEVVDESLHNLRK